MVTVRKIRPEDVPACVDIYNFYIRETTVTFEEDELDAEEFGVRVGRILGDEYPYIVAEEQGRVLGYAYLDMYSPRTAYRYTADLSIYVANGGTARGVGRLMYEEIERSARQLGLRNIISVITEHNRPSVAFHERHGFTLAGKLDAVGYKFDRWLGVLMYQKRI